MLDPFFSPPHALSALVQPLADKLGLPIITLHIHEILISFTIYHLINTRLSPAISRRLCPEIYNNLNPRTKVNWDVHVVSLAQSTVINILALWVIFYDEERKAMSWQERIWGYTGAAGMVQGFAAGYFLWDLMVSTMNVPIFGWGLLAHAICALVVFSLGFRPFVNSYAPTFILYELSSPFLNFHWFFDKLNLTGSRWQLVNGIVLLATFFFCRLVWGTYQSIRVYQDVWAGLYSPPSELAPHDILGNSTVAPLVGVMRFATKQEVPFWLAMTYLGSNIVLNTLNFYWFGKMIETVRKRFQPPKEKKERPTTHIKEDGDSQVGTKTSAEVDGKVDLNTLDEMEIRRRKA